MAKYTSPTANPTFPPTLEDCEEEPKSCRYMKGTLIEGMMYDAKCIKPIEGCVLGILVQGWEGLIEVPTVMIEKVLCGKGRGNKGVERDVRIVV